MTVVSRQPSTGTIELAYRLESTTADVRYLARQLDRAVDYLRRGLSAEATEAVNRGCQALDRVCAVLCTEDAEAA